MELSFEEISKLKDNASNKIEEYKRELKIRAEKKFKKICDKNLDPEKQCELIKAFKDTEYQNWNTFINDIKHLDKEKYKEYKAKIKSDLEEIIAHVFKKYLEPLAEHIHKEIKAFAKNFYNTKIKK